MFLSKEEASKIYKEVFCYEYYTKSKYLNRIGNIEEAFKHVHIDGVKIEDFITSLEKSGSRINETEFDMQKFSLYYCE